MSNKYLEKIASKSEREPFSKVKTIPSVVVGSGLGAVSGILASGGNPHRIIRKGATALGAVAGGAVGYNNSVIKQKYL